MASLKTPCKVCGLPYLKGKAGGCLACLRGGKPIGLQCECGEIAVVVLLDRIGGHGEYGVEIPLCARCLAIEQEGWRR